MSCKPETLFRKRVQTFLKPFELSNEIKCFWTQELSQVGVPDCLLSYYGEFMGLEIKSEDGKLSEMQKFNLKGINLSKGYSVALWPSGFEKFKKDFSTRTMPRIERYILNYRDGILSYRTVEKEKI